MQGLIEDLESILDRAIRVPASGKLLVDEATIRQIVAQMRTSMPDETRVGQRLAGERERVLAEARAQAHRIIEEAQAQLNNRLDEQTIVQQARERARLILTEAEQQANKVRSETNQYVLAQFSNLEGRLQRMLREVQAGERFVAGAKPEKDAPETGHQS